MCGSRFSLKFQMNHKSNSFLMSHVYLDSVLFNAEKDRGSKYMENVDRVKWNRTIFVQDAQILLP